MDVTHHRSALDAGFARRLLHWSSRVFFLTVLAGQLAFVAFILGFFVRHILAGNIAGWSEKRLITGYVAGDDTGNTMFAIHVCGAALLTLSGLIQLIPAIRQRAPRLHRWNGRAFIAMAILMSLGGLWLTWVRGSYLSLVAGFAVSLNGILILVFAILALVYALKRDFVAHSRWAMRTFIVVSGVWFLRLSLMAWLIINGGPVGMNGKMSGPADIFLDYGSYLIPLAILEVYFLAKRSNLPWVKAGTAMLVLVGSLLMAVGVFGAMSILWLPHM